MHDKHSSTSSLPLLAIEIGIESQESSRSHAIFLNERVEKYSWKITMMFNESLADVVVSDISR